MNAASALFLSIWVQAVVIAAEAPVVVIAGQARQLFDGFGLVLSGSQTALPERTRGLRWVGLPLDLQRISPKQGERNLDEVVGAYIDSGLLAKANAVGLTEVVLLPEGVPKYMLDNATTPAAGGDHPLVYEFVPKYALLLGDVIERLRQRGVAITAVNIAARTLHITPDQWSQSVQFLQAILQARGLASVGIAAVGWPADDGGAVLRLDAIRRDQAAWGGLGLVLATVQGMAITGDLYERFCLPDGKRLWLLSSGAEAPAAQAVAALQAGCSAYGAQSLTATGRLSAAWHPGTRLHAVTVDHRLAAAAGIRPDGSWVLALAQRGEARAATTVNVVFEPLASSAELGWILTTKQGGQPARTTSRQGRMSLSLPPGAIVVAESTPP